MKRKGWFTVLVCILVVLSACASNGGGSGGGSAGGAAPADPPQPSASPAGAQTPDPSEEPKQEPVELRMAWWGSQERHDKTLAAIELFEKKYPHITIVGEYSGFDGYFDKLNTQLAAGNAPDIIQMGGNIKEYYDRGALYDLNEFVGSALDVSQLADSMIKEAAFDGGYYGVSVGVSGNGLMYNKNMFERAGIAPPSPEWTYEDFKSIVTELSQKLGDGYYGSYDLSNKKEVLSDWLASEGIQVYKDGNIGFTREDMIRWFTMWDELRKAGAIVPPEIQVANNPDAADKSLVVTGKVAIQFAAASQIFGYQGLTQDTLALITSPVGSKGTGMQPPPSGQFMTVYAKSKHPKEAAMFIDFMINDEEGARTLGNTRGVPPSAAVREMLAAESTPVDKVLYDHISLSAELASNFEYEPFPLDTEFIDLLRLASEQIAFGQISIENGVDQFMTEVEKLLQKVK